MGNRGVTIRVSREHAELLQQIKEKFCYPSFTSASQWLTVRIREDGLFEERKLEEKKLKGFRLRV